MIFVVFFTNSPETQPRSIKLEARKFTNGIINYNYQGTSFKAICRFF